MTKKAFSLARVDIRNVLSPDSFGKVTAFSTAIKRQPEKAVTKEMVLDTLKEAGIVDNDGHLTPTYAHSK